MSCECLSCPFKPTDLLEFTWGTPKEYLWDSPDIRREIYRRILWDNTACVAVPSDWPALPPMGRVRVANPLGSVFDYTFS